MAGVGTKITATDYNTIQSKIKQVLGTGADDYGYGPDAVLVSSTVAAHQRVTVTQWRNLRSDILKARTHQTATPGDLVDPGATGTKKITEDDRLAYYNMAVDCQTNRLVAPPAGQAASVSLATGTRSTPWNGVLTHTVTLTFASADAMRYYFNTGSEVRITASRAGGTGTTKDQSWSNLLGTDTGTFPNGMGIIKFNHNSTTCTGTGIQSVIGYRQLTTSDQEIFRKNASSYLPNSYYITARANAAIGTATQIIFTIRFDDANVPPESTPDPGFSVDEDVTGTTTSTVVTYHSSGVVPVSPPSGPGAITL